MAIWKSEIYAAATAYAKIFLRDFQFAISRHQMAPDSRKYHHSTQNQKLHRTVPLDFFQKKSTFPLCFNFTNSK